MKKHSLENSPKFQQWKSRLESSGCTINNIEILFEKHKSNGELLFSLLNVDATSPDNKKLLPIVFLRGDASIIIPLIRNKDTKEEKFLMILQRRIAMGEENLEFPAGMMDLEIDKPMTTAVIELEEETGVKIDLDSVFPLSNKPLFSSPGASDEAIHYFGTIINMNNNDFNSLEGRIRGLESENEHIKVTLKTRAEAEPEIHSLQARLGFYLFDEYLKRDSNIDNS